MKYENHYKKLIETRQRLNRNKKEARFEQHHILPKSLGGGNGKRNLILLTPREHFIAHRLLYKMHTGRNKAKMAYALFKMMQCNSKQHRSCNSYQYEKARQAVQTTCNGTNHHNTGTKKTEEQKRHLRNLRLGQNNPMYGIEPWNKGLTKETSKTIEEQAQRLSEKHARGEISYHNFSKSTECRQKISDAQRGRSKSEEHKKKLSDALKGRKIDPEIAKKSADSRRGKKQPLITCPHCGKEGALSSMYRWHFSKCKQLVGPEGIELS